LKVTGVDLFSAGNFTGGEGTEEIVLSDPRNGVYKKLVLKDDRLVGSVLYGDTVDGAWYFKLLRDRKNVAEIRDRLMFGEADRGGDALSRVAHAERLRDLPSRAQLLPALDVAARGRRRSAIALHQRARARQHPEERHVFRRAADVGRRNVGLRIAPHRGRRRQ